MGEYLNGRCAAAERTLVVPVLPPPPAATAYPLREPGTVIYAGGTQVWQNVARMADAIREAPRELRFVMLSGSAEQLGRELEAGRCRHRVEIGSVPASEVPSWLQRAEFGFVLRSDSAINRVACPTKLVEYLDAGVIPVVLEPEIGDFAQLGYAYLPLSRLRPGQLPGPAEREGMRQANYVVMRKLREQAETNVGSLVAFLVSALHSGPPSGGLRQLGKNITGLSLVQAVNYLVPLVLIPYLVRVLGLTAFGVVVLAQAANRYLDALNDYGFSLSATRGVACRRGHWEEIGPYCAEVMEAKAVLFAVCGAIMAGLCATVPPFSRVPVAFLSGLALVAGDALLPAWFFQGLEESQRLVAAVAAGRVGAALGIVLLVRSPSDYAWAILLPGVGVLGAGVWAFALMRRRCGPHWRWAPPRRVAACLREHASVCLANSASTVLASSGDLVLGLVTSGAVLGAYAACEKIAKAVLALFAPLTQGLLPFNSARFQRSYSQGRRAVTISGLAVSAVAFVVAGALALGSTRILHLLYGSRAADLSAGLLAAFGVWVVLGVINNFLGIQFLLGGGWPGSYSRAFALATAVQLAILYPFCRWWAGQGALAAMGAAEGLLTCLLVVTVIRLDRRMRRATPPAAAASA
jgi:PST family polysaccharide transporter